MIQNVHSQTASHRYLVAALTVQSTAHTHIHTHTVIFMQFKQKRRQEMQPGQYSNGLHLKCDDGDGQHIRLTRAVCLLVIRGSKNIAKIELSTCHRF